MYPSESAAKISSLALEGLIAIAVTPWLKLIAGRVTVVRLVPSVDFWITGELGTRLNPA